MFQGNWTCSKCGGDITQLPFEPRSNSGLTCRDCYFNAKQGDASGAASSSESAAPAEVDTGTAAPLDDREAPPFDPEASGVADEPAPPPPERADAPVVEKKQFTGEWQCSVCGGAITSLPFEPRSTDGLKCIDCFKQSKG